VKAEIGEIDSHLSPEDEINFYRLIQEALANVMKHSQAREVHCRISADESGILATIRDDGRGFDLARARELGRIGQGLIGMEERVHLMGGQFRIVTMPGKGTHLKMAIPTKENAT
jgi:signal transduction histidine kinase